jgi:hypothetical protein
MMKSIWDDWSAYNGFPLTEARVDLQNSAVSFNELNKALKDFGIQLTEISYATMDSIPEIKGYLIGSVKTSTGLTSRPYPKKVIFSGPATTILWKDGTKTTVKCQDEDVWDEEVGIAMCYLKKLLGNKGNFNNIFREAMKVAVVKPTKEKDLVYGEPRSLSDVIDQMADISVKINDAFKKMNGGK